MNNKCFPSKIIFAANSLSFLNCYKLSLSKLFIKDGINVEFHAPHTSEELEKYVEKEIPIKKLCKNKKGLFSFFQIYFYFLKLLICEPKTSIVSHTVYLNIALIIATFTFPWKAKCNFITVSGFGAARIRNSLRIRLLGRIYIFLLRIASKQKSLNVITLNFNDLTIIQDFLPERNVYLLDEAAVNKEDIELGNEVANKRIESLFNKKLKVGFIGRFLLEKGLNDFIQVVEKSKKIGLDLEFSIAGKYDDNNNSSLNIKQISSKYPDVKLFKEPKYQDYFKEIDILLFCSYREGHPLFLLKSMSYGVVPVVYPVPGVGNDVISEYNGLIANQIHPSALVSKILELNKNRNKIINFSKNCLKYVKTNFQSNVTLSFKEFMDNKLYA